MMGGGEIGTCWRIGDYSFTIWIEYEQFYTSKNYIFFFLIQVWHCFHFWFNFCL